ncbi:unnamed protein product [Adineta steineri]|uniref:Tr-type G domain-containing protein n=1 Tax=Adineta steineri TaxID=433720 RepID=A0A814YZG6_9BILA|nr:unnamed protein product [Adineta steineri]
MNEEKPHISIIIIGRVDSGKSILTERLLYECGNNDEQKERPAFQSNNWMKSLRTSWNRDILVDASLQKCETIKYRVTLIDTPGHRDFVKNFINKISQVDSAILVVAATYGEFESGIRKGGQTREHILLAYTFGITQLIVAVNKMDTIESTDSERRFNEIKTEVSNFVKRLGYEPQRIIFVPISSWNGDNISEVSNKMSWFENWTIQRKENHHAGKTLVDAINAIIPSMRLINKPLRIPLQAVYKMNGVGTVAIGRVETGVLKTNMIVSFAPSTTMTEVKSIEMYHKTLKEALPGDIVGFNLKGISTHELRHGFVCSDPENNPALVASSFIAQIIVIDHPNEIKQGYTPIFHCHTAHIPCQFAELIEKYDRRTGSTIEKTPKSIKAGDTAFVKIIPMKPICVEKFVDYPSLGRFAIRDIKLTIAIGIIKDATHLSTNL